MQETKLVLSNASTFFSGRIEAVFRKAKKSGFQYLEIIPYRWLRPEKILALEKKYQIEVAGIHFPLHWNLTAKQIWQSETGFMKKIFSQIWHFYLGSGKNNPAWQLIELLRQQNRNPYLVFHANVVKEIPAEHFKALANIYLLAIENSPYETPSSTVTWSPIAIKKNYGASCQVVFDHQHYLENLKLSKGENPVQVYKTVEPEILHLGYHHGNWFFGHHVMPNQKEQAELKKMLRINKPIYWVNETNSLVNASKVKKLMETLLDENSS